MPYASARKAFEAWDLAQRVGDWTWFAAVLDEGALRQAAARAVVRARQASGPLHTYLPGLRDALGAEHGTALGGATASEEAQFALQVASEAPIAELLDLLQPLDEQAAPRRAACVALRLLPFSRSATLSTRCLGRSAFSISNDVTRATSSGSRISDPFGLPTPSGGYSNSMP